MLTHAWNSAPLPGFIVFEGLDGAGTTTQARRLVAWMRENGIPAEFTCEPTDLPTGRLIRDLLADAGPVEPWTLALLFAADRHEHLVRPESGIRDRLAAGVSVVSDRYLFSSLAYQGAYADSAAVEHLNVDFPLPEVLVFVDTPRDEADRRMRSRSARDRLEQAEVQLRVEERYRGIVAAFAAHSATRVVSVDGSRAADAVFADILAGLER